ncbi:DUF6482 family protein [Motiliproteus sp. SC1-56]|uniref:DUF6482 family protein n=1 Tax=Motiliproteus sp. SC1-56 TaxID=2799565 RepID=UPI001A8DF577|nr:DUF6482 family protein [Motiliproteus sp. SC1-56]
MKYSDFTEEAQQGRVSAINILSNEGDIYTAEAVIHGTGYTIERRDSAEPLCFHSYREAKQQFEFLKNTPVRLQPSHAYEEMVGEPGMES